MKKINALFYILGIIFCVSMINKLFGQKDTIGYSYIFMPFITVGIGWVIYELYVGFLENVMPKKTYQSLIAVFFGFLTLVCMLSGSDLGQMLGYAFFALIPFTTIFFLLLDVILDKQTRH